MNLWPLVPFREILREERSRIGTVDANNLPLLGVSNADGLHRSGMPRISDMSRYLRVERNWFAYNPMRINVGSIGWAERETQTGVISPDYVVFSCTERVHPQLVYWFLRHRQGLRAINAETAGSVRERLYFDSLARIEFPLPPMHEQRQLVGRIEALNAKIEKATELRQELAEDTSALMNAASRQVFTNLQTEATPLNDVCTAIIDCLHSNPVYADDGIPTVRSPDVGWGRLFLNTARKTSEAEYRRRTSRGEPTHGDIVVVREGGGTGKAGIVERGQRFSLGQRVMLLRPNLDKIEPKYLLYQWLSPLVYEDQIMSRMKGSASPHLNIGVAKAFDIRLPPMSRQRQIVADLDGLREKAEELNRTQAAASDELQAMLPAILDRAFKGEL